MNTNRNFIGIELEEWMKTMNNQIKLTPFYELPPKERAERYRKCIEKISKDAPPYNCLVTNEEEELLRMLEIIEEDKKG